MEKMAAQDIAFKKDRGLSLLSHTSTSFNWHFLGYTMPHILAWSMYVYVFFEAVGILGKIVPIFDLTNWHSLMLCL